MQDKNDTEANLPDDTSHDQVLSSDQSEPAADNVTATTADDLPAEEAAAPTTGLATDKDSAGNNEAGKNKLRLVLELVLLVSVVVLGLFTYKLYAEKQTLQNQLSSAQADPQALVKRQTDAIIAAVARLMELPSDETPTVADVADAAAAKAQSPFFNTAQNGDKVLMYVKKGEAILYRPSTNKVVLVAPLTFNQQAATGAATTKNPAAR